MPTHKIVHVEFPAVDPEKGASFYADVFGWQIQPIPEMDYATFTTGNSTDVGGGFARIDNKNTYPGMVTVYIETDDIDATLAKINAGGGQTLAPKMEIPSTGWFGIFRDPDGNAVGLYTPFPR